MQVILLPREPGWVELYCGSDKLLAAVKQSIARSAKRYDYDKRLWLVHHTWLAWLVSSARRYGLQVDYSRLPNAWQLMIAGAQVPVEDPNVMIIDEAPYAILHVSPDAPTEVVHAAYRALAQLHHPDKGGNADTFRKISEARDSILKARGE